MWENLTCSYNKFSVLCNLYPWWILIWRGWEREGRSLRMLSAVNISYYDYHLRLPHTPDMMRKRSRIGAKKKFWLLLKASFSTSKAHSYTSKLLFYRAITIELGLLLTKIITSFTLRFKLIRTKKYTFITFKKNSDTISQKIDLIKILPKPFFFSKNLTNLNHQETTVPIRHLFFYLAVTYWRKLPGKFMGLLCLICTLPLHPPPPSPTSLSLYLQHIFTLFAVKLRASWEHVPVTPSVPPPIDPKHLPEHRSRFLPGVTTSSSLPPPLQSYSVISRRPGSSVVVDRHLLTHQLFPVAWKAISPWGSCREGWVWTMVF